MFYNWKWRKVTKVRDLAFWETLFRTVSDYDVDYGKYGIENIIKKKLTTIQKELPVWILEPKKETNG